MGVFVCADKHALCMCRGQRLTLGVFLSCFFYILWDSTPHFDLILTDSASVAGQEASGIVYPVSAFPVMEL